MKLPTRDQLVKRRAIVTSDAEMKLAVGDNHGCADACMDLREIEAQLAMMNALHAAAEDSPSFRVAFLDAFGANALA